MAQFIKLGNRFLASPATPYPSGGTTMTTPARPHKDQIIYSNEEYERHLEELQAADRWAFDRIKELEAAHADLLSRFETLAEIVYRLEGK